MRSLNIVLFDVGVGARYKESMSQTQAFCGEWTVIRAAIFEEVFEAEVGRNISRGANRLYSHLTHYFSETF